MTVSPPPKSPNSVAGELSAVATMNEVAIPPRLASPITTLGLLQGRNMARKAISGFAMAFSVAAKWYTVFPANRVNRMRNI